MTVDLQSPGILIEIDKQKIFINPEEILYAESRRHKVFIKTVKDAYLAGGDLNRLQPVLVIRFIEQAKSSLTTGNGGNYRRSGRDSFQVPENAGRNLIPALKSLIRLCTAHSKRQEERTLARRRKRNRLKPRPSLI
jgi:hypothetical protein